MPRPRVSVFIAQSLDGYIATDDDSLDWLTAAGAEGEDYGFDAFLDDVDVVAMGRSTYDFIKDFPELPYGGRPVHVFTSRALGPREGFEFYARTPLEAVEHWQQNGVQHVYIDGGYRHQPVPRRRTGRRDHPHHGAAPARLGEAPVPPHRYEHAAAARRLSGVRQRNGQPALPEGVKPLGQRGCQLAMLRAVTAATRITTPVIWSRPSLSLNRM